MLLLNILALLYTLVLSLDHGACTEYCGRIYYVSKEGYRGDASQNFSQRSTGCGTYEILNESNYESICTPTYDYAGPEWRRRTSACFNSFWYDPCPLGWSHQPAYDDYEPGCYRGSHYPNPIKAYDGPSPEIGSTHKYSSESIWIYLRYFRDRKFLRYSYIVYWNGYIRA